MWVTCYADASFSSVDGGAWAVWMQCGPERLVRSGVCPPYVHDPVAAELAALYAGAFLATQRWGPSVRVVALRSDCRGALELADHQRRLSKNAACRRLQTKLRELVGAHGLELHCRWVRGASADRRGHRRVPERTLRRARPKEPPRRRSFPIPRLTS
ncbi:MAG: hypothetical protein M3Y87_25105 [Myxococcota bacterium]|nr:hypothetical protein [Myxococcota bacterium]